MPGDNTSGIVEVTAQPAEVDGDRPRPTNRSKKVISASAIGEAITAANYAMRSAPLSFKSAEAHAKRVERALLKSGIPSWLVKDAIEQAKRESARVNGGRAAYLNQRALTAEIERAGYLEQAAEVSGEPDAQQEPQTQPVPAAEQQTEPFEHAGLRIYPIRVRVGDGVEQRWAVQMPENKGTDKTLGDTLHATPDDARAQAEREVARAESDRERAAGFEREAAVRREQDEARKAANRGKSISQLKADAALDKQVTEGGKTMTRRQWVEGKVAEGLDPRVTQEDKIKPMSRAQFNRATNEEQRAHERKVKAAGKKDVYWIGNYEVTKAEYDYAASLRQQTDAQSAAEPASDATQSEAQERAAPEAGSASLAPAARFEALRAAGTDDPMNNAIRALAQVAGRSGETNIDLWRRWSSVMGMGEMDRRTGKEVVETMQGALLKRPWVDSALPSGPVDRTSALSADSLRRQLESFERQAQEFDRFVEAEEARIADVENMQGSEEAISNARDALGKMKAKVAANRAEFESSIKNAEERQAAFQKEQRDKIAARWSGTPTDAELSKKPTLPQAADTGWFNVTYKGKLAHSTGNILDLSEPHLKGWQNRMNAMRSSDQPIAADKVFPEGKGSQLEFIASYSPQSGEKDAGRSAYALKSGSSAIFADAAYIRYFTSKYKDATFFTHKDPNGPISVRSGGELVGILMPIRNTGAEVRTPDDVAAIVAEGAAVRGDASAVGSNQSQQAEPADEPTKSDAPAPSAPGRVENFGEALPGGRTARTPSLDRELTNEDIASMPFSKIWPLEEIDGIEDKFQAALAYAIREIVPKIKPRKSYALKRWVDQVQAARSMASEMLRLKDREELVARMRETSRGLAGFADKVELLDSIERDQWKRIGNVRAYPEAYSMKDGQKLASPVVGVVIDGKPQMFDGAKSVAEVIDRVNEMLAGDSGQKRMKFEIRQAPKSGKYFINKAGDRDYNKLKTFDTLTEARAALRDNYDDLVKAWDEVKARDNVSKADVRRDENRPRTGADRRGGRDVTGEMFQETFGFMGGEFGKWVSQGAGAKERQGLLNQTYDALMDLADITGLPPRALSLGGTLGIAFGSRGSGRAAAHFEPSNLVVSMTKTRGAGTLAHEWFHALDNYFSRQRGGEVTMKEVKGSQEEYRRNNYITYKPEPMMVHRAVGKSSAMSKERLAYMREKNPNSGYFRPEHWIVDPSHKPGVRVEVERAFAELVEALDKSPMAARASANDNGENGYWGRIIERAARAFENFTIARMMEKGYSNDFLANVRPVEDFARDRGRYPYLLPEEVAPIASAFDNLFGTIQVRNDNGKSILFSRQAGSAQQAAGPAPVRRQVLEGIVNRVAGNWSIPVRVVETPADLPDAIKAAAAEYGPDALSGVEGVIDGDAIYIVASSITSPKHALTVLAHEGIGHYGMETMLGDRFDKTLADVLALRDSGKLDAAVAQQVAERYDGADDATWAKEAIAIMAERGVENSVMARVIAATRRFLREIGFKVEFSDADLRAMIGDAARVVQSGSKGGARGAMAPAFSRAGDQTQTPEFKRWFGNSKVVDANGDPLVVYHGTRGDFSVFDSARQGQSDFGASGRGFYFSQDPGTANVYATLSPGDGASNVMPVYVKLDNPLELGALLPQNEAESRLLTERAKAAGHDGIIVRGADGVLEEIVAFRPEQIKSATGNRGTFDPADPRITFSFAGINSRTAQLHSNVTAMKRLAAGEDAETVRAETGWFRGADGKWRYEISDRDARIKLADRPVAARFDTRERAERANKLVRGRGVVEVDGRWSFIPRREDENIGMALSADAGGEPVQPGVMGTTVGRLLDHPRLLEAYPDLRRLPVGLLPKSSQSRGKLTRDGVMLREDLSLPEALSTLLHELQHGIQHIEGFAGGGNLDFVQSLDEYREASSSGLPADQAAYEVYRRLAGEVEARNVQARRQLSDEFIAIFPPEMTADVPAERVIVVMNGKVMPKAPRPANALPAPRDMMAEAGIDEAGNFGTDEAPRSLSATVNEAITRAPSWTGDAPRFSIRNPQTQTAEFRRWFDGASRFMRMPDGSPRTFYHGTNGDFDSFDPQRAGTVKYSDWGKGIYLTPNAGTADYYRGEAAKNADPESERMWAQLEEMEKLRTWDNGSPTYPEGYRELLSQWRARRAVAEDESGSIIPVFAAIRNPYIVEYQSTADPTVAERAIERGHDGIVVLRLNGSVDEVVAFRPEQLKSAIGNRGTFDPADPRITFSMRAPTFYSAAVRAIEQGQGAPRRGDAAAWKGWLDGAVRRGEMKQSERDWLDIDGWLDRQSGAVTREALAEFVRANEVKVEEVRLGATDEDAIQARIDAINDEYNAILGDRALADLSPSEKARIDELTAEHDRLADEELSAARNSWQRPKFDQYRLPGGENYRELLLTLPGNSLTDAEVESFYARDPAAGRQPFWMLSDAQRAAVAKQAARERGEYRSSHWDQPNVLAHIRMDERTDADGKRVLFIQEIQSDWHQAGRKKGYGRRWALVHGNAQTDEPMATFESEEQARAAARAWNAENPYDDYGVDAVLVDGIPNAPLKATDEWAMLAFKRAARWAVDNGFDRIAWATGEQNADLFDLSKQVESIGVRVTPNKRYVKIKPSAGAEIGLGVENDGTISGDSTNASVGKPLEDVIGKEMAERVMAFTENGELSGDGLKVGGEGMRGFYDKILPSAVGKWGKKFGAKVGRTEFVGIDGPDDATAVHAIDVTPAMREAVQAGQPLFSMRRRVAEAIANRNADARQTWLKALTRQQIVDVGRDQFDRDGVNLASQFEQLSVRAAFARDGG